MISSKRIIGAFLLGVMLVSATTNCMAGSSSYKGTYVTTYVSNTKSSASADVFNSQPQYNRYAMAWEHSYNKSGTLISNKTNADNITSGGRTALDMNLSNNYKTSGGGRIYSGKTPSTTLLESKTLTVYV